MLLNIVNPSKAELPDDGLAQCGLNEVRAICSNLQSHSNLDKSKMNILVTLPNSYEQGRDIARELLSGKIIVVNFLKLSVADKQRIFDFLNGVAYTLDAEIKQVTADTIVYMPENFAAMKLRF